MYAAMWKQGCAKVRADLQESQVDGTEANFFAIYFICFKNWSIRIYSVISSRYIYMACDVRCSSQRLIDIFSHLPLTIAFNDWSLLIILTGKINNKRDTGKHSIFRLLEISNWFVCRFRCECELRALGGRGVTGWKMLKCSKSLR